MSSSQKQSRCEQSVGERIKEARIRAGLSQAQLSKLLGIRRPAVSDIESGKRSVKSDELYEIAALLEVSIEWLVTGDNSVDDSAVLFAARELARLPEESRRSVIDLIRSLGSRGEVDDENK